MRLRRRRAFIANVGGQLVLIVPSATRRSRNRSVSPRVNQLSVSMRGLPSTSGVTAQIGIGSSGGGQILQGPPGVQFLGTGGQVVVPASGQAPRAGSGFVYLENGRIATGVPATSGVQGNPQIPNSNLRISGLNAKGELIITGPGGAITIGTDLLNGISRQNQNPVFTEFEEMEMEGNPNSTTGNRQPNRFQLNKGQGAIIIERSPRMANGGIVDPLHTGSGEAVSAASSSSASASAGGAAASSSAASSAGGAASSASASAGGVSSASSSAVSLGNGISLENGGQIIRLGETHGTQTITLGGSNGQIKLGEGGSGIQVPGNATFIVGG